MTSHGRILVGMAVGSLAGAVLHAIAPESPATQALLGIARPVGQVFLRSLLALVIPLVFCSLALGVAELGDPRRLGRIGLRALVYTVSVSAIAVLIGVGAVALVRPGEGLPDAVRAALLDGASERAAIITSRAAPKSGVEMLVGIVPDNLLRAAVENDVLAVMFAAVVLGLALTSVASDGARLVTQLLGAVQELAMFLVGAVLRFAPVGVGALLFAIVGEVGWSIVIPLGRYVAVVLGALLFHQVVVYGIAVRVLGGMSPLAFFSAIQQAMLTAFSTASSAATLPTSLEVADRLGLPRHVSRFVLTVGATANQNGTALFEGVTVLFLAQFYGVALDPVDQVTVAAICVLGGIGTAGVPAGSLPVVVMILGMIGVPAEGIGLILGIDRFLDMCRTTLNVTGDLVAAVVVSRGEPLTDSQAAPRTADDPPTSTGA